MKNRIVSLLLVCGVLSVDADEVKSVLVMEGDSVTLHTDLTLIQTSDVIRWRFGEGESRDLLVDIAQNCIRYNGPFKDRLHADSQTGDLTITNMRIKHSGPYEVQISRAGTIYKRFRVDVTVAPSVISAGDVKSVTEGDSVTLNTDVQTQRDDLILWRFGDDGVLIAKHDKEDNKSSIFDDADGRLRDRLKLDPHTGSLIITNTKTTDTGLYKLKISSNRDTKSKTFSVSVSDGGLSSGGVVGIVFVVLLCVVVGVIVFRRIYKRQKRMAVTVKDKIGKNRNSVTLESDVTELRSDDVIQWSFRDKVIVIFSMNNKLFTDEQRLRDRLQVDDQTGSLIITNIRTEDAGLYKVKISSSSRLKSFLQFITGGGPSYYQFSVIVSADTEREDAEVLGDFVSLEIDVTERETGDVRAGASSTGDDIQLKVLVRERIKPVVLGDSVTLETDVTEIQTDDLIQWIFGDEESLIAELTVGTNPSYLSTDERFRERLKMNPQTGDLIISNITSELSGVYRAKIISSKRRRGTENRKYKLVISDTETQTDDVIRWKLKVTVIAQFNRMSNFISYDDPDGRFRGRLVLNDQTGSLTITGTRSKDSGLYNLNMNNSKHIIHKRFNVTVTEPTDIYWKTIGPGLLIGVIVLGLIVFLLVLIVIGLVSHKIHKWCRNRNRLNKNTANEACEELNKQSFNTNGTYSTRSI